MRNEQIVITKYEDARASGRGTTRRTSTGLLLAALLLLALTFGAASNVAQAQVCITVTGSSPSQITQGTSGILIITGSNFTATTKVRLVGVPDIQYTLISDSQLQAAIPSNLAIGLYIVEISDPNNPPPPTCAAPAARQLNVIAPPAPTNPPTAPPIPTLAPPPTDIPGTPNLIVRSFSATPNTIKPGDTVVFTIDVFNQGNRTAQGIAVTIDPGGKFIASGGQASVILPDIGVGGSTVFTIAAVAASDTPGGPQTVGLTFNYRDFSGQTYSTKGAVTVTVETLTQASQVTLSRYRYDPNPVLPGEPVTVTVLLTNTGNQIAQQVLVQVSADGIMLAGPQGNSFPVGDIPAGGSASVDMPLIVSTTAKTGPQSQAISIAYLQGGEAKNYTGSMTLDVAKVTVPAPVMLLDSYETGSDYLQPGQRFTLSLSLKNIGDADASGLSVSFGSVDDNSGGSGTPTGSSFTPSTTFAPLGSGGTLFVGDVQANSEPFTLEQEFIVSGSVDSGVFGLPITLRYTQPDGTASQTKLSASLVVLVPPQLRIVEAPPLPETVSAGDSISLALEIANRGRKGVNFTTAIVTAENGEVLDGAETYLGPLRNDDDTIVTATVIAQAPGPMTITVTLNYTDDLNQPQAIVETYTIEALEAPNIDFEQPTPDFGFPPPDFGGGQGETPAADSEDLLGRLLLGLLGLGS